MYRPYKAMAGTLLHRRHVQTVPTVHPYDKFQVPRNPDAATETPTQPLPTFVPPFDFVSRQVHKPPCHLFFLKKKLKKSCLRLPRYAQYVWLGPSQGIPNRRRKSKKVEPPVLRPFPAVHTLQDPLRLAGIRAQQRSTSTAAMLYRLKTPPTSCPLSASL